ncbi:glycosyltransferase family 4 protein [Acetobacter conturbans]|nr:glycosyltransferase family 4 protein [Acetobacter conturbans]
MKIMHILNEFVDVGNGIVNVCCDLACMQAKMGYDVVVVSRGGGHVALLEQCGGRHVTLDQTRKVGNVLPMMWNFAKILKAEKPDIVHSHMMTGAGLAALFRKLRFPFRTVSTVHNVYQKSFRIMCLSDLIVCLSDRVRQQISAGHRNANRMIVIENGVIGSPRRADPATVEPLKLDRPAIITIGGVCERKGADIFLDAMEQLGRTDIHVYWIGNKDWPEFETRLNASSMRDNFHLVGFEGEPLRYLKGADLFVLASRRETFPLSILEAKEAGLPIICSDVDGNADAVREGKEGLLVSVGSSEKLAAAISKVLSSPELASSLAEASRESCVRYSVDTMTREYITAYQKLLAAR